RRAARTRSRMLGSSSMTSTCGGTSSAMATSSVLSFLGDPSNDAAAGAGSFPPQRSGAPPGPERHGESEKRRTVSVRGVSERKRRDRCGVGRRGGRPRRPAPPALRTSPVRTPLGLSDPADQCGRRRMSPPGASLCHVRIATWNVNSMRARADRVSAWLERSDVDGVAVQETKCRDDQFPASVFTDLGYEVAHHGLGQWNGVALASRVGLEEVRTSFDGQPGYGEPEEAEARAVSAVCGGVRVWSLYVPNGREVDHPHYAYKLRWLEALRAEGAARLAEDPRAQI